MTYVIIHASMNCNYYMIIIIICMVWNYSLGKNGNDHPILLYHICIAHMAHGICIYELLTK